MLSSMPVLSLDIGGTNIRAALIHASFVRAMSVTGWPDGLSPEREVDFVADHALRLIREHGPTAGAIGVSLAALVDKDGKVLEWPNRPAWRGIDFRRRLEARLSRPVIVEDDCNAAALAESLYGAGRGHRHLIVLMVGTGVGAGLVLDGRLFQGKHGWAGEIGHMTVLAEGPECSCGKRGCLQMVASGRALERLAIERGLAGGPDIAAAAATGEEWAKDALRDCGRWIGLAAANAVNLLDLEAVVIGGGLSHLNGIWWEAIEEALQTNLLIRTHRTISLSRATLSDTAGLVGAASLARQASELSNPEAEKQYEQ